MNCPNCGAEVGNNKFCEFCGSQISVEMQKEQERINKKGCPNCGSSNIAFSREKQGEYKGKKGSSIVRSTVGLCNDCGYTWKTDDGVQNAKKRKTWLWVLGWIYLFPVPLTILLLRKKEMKPAIKYGIIAVAWIVYLIIAFSGKSSNSESAVVSTPTVQVEEIVEEETPAAIQVEEIVEAETPTDVQVEETLDTESEAAFELEINADEIGDYGRELTLNAGTEFEDSTIGYFVPAGTYTVKNIGEYMTQVNVYKEEINVTEEGWEEWADGNVELIDVEETKEMVVEDGYFFNVDAPANIIVTKIG